MNLLTIAWKSIRQRMLASSLTSLSVALGVSLMIAVLIINGIVARIFNQTGTGYDLILGPKGSQLQLVLSTVYRIGGASEPLPWVLYQNVLDDPRIELAVPVNVGDNMEEGEFPIVGTTPQYFAFEVTRGEPFRIPRDHRFLQGTWDAVIGSEVARVTGYDVGSQFRLIHSGDADHVHDELFTVVGVLAPTGTPNDRTAFVHIDGFFQLDEHDKPINDAIDRVAEALDKTPEQVREQFAEDLAQIAEEQSHDHSHGGHAHAHFVSDLQKEVTAIMVRMATNPDSVLDAETQRTSSVIFYSSEVNEGFKMQAVRPLVPMLQLMDNLVGNVRLALQILTALIIVVSGISIFVSIYNSMADRKKEIAIMRALGASRQTVFSVILAESLLLCVGGGIIGILLGHGLVFVAAPIVEARSGLLIDPLAFEMLELYIIPAMLLLASIVGFLPGLTAYRTDVADALHG